MSRKIIGVTVGTSLPKPNWAQTDPNKGDFIKNKPSIPIAYDGTKVPLIDQKTGKTYVMFVSDGKLMMQESEE